MPTSFLVFPCLLGLAIGSTIFLAPNIQLIPGALQTYDHKRLLQLAILVSLLAWLAFSTRKSIDLGRLLYVSSGSTRLSMAGLWTLGLLAALTAPSPRYGLLEFTTFCGLFLLAMTLAATSRATLLSLMKGILVTGITGIAFYETTWLSYYTFHLASTGSLPSRDMLYFGFSNLRFLNHLQIWWLAPLLAFALSIRHKILRKFSLACLAIWICILIRSYSLGAFLALLCTFVMLFTLRPESRDFLVRLAEILLAGGLLYFALFHLPAWIIDVHDVPVDISWQNFQDHARLTLWRLALSAIQESPWTGIGPLHFSNIPNDVAAHPHNALLQIGAEFGLPFLFLAFTLFFRAGWQVLRSSPRPSPSALPQFEHAVVFSLVAGAGYSLVSGVLVTPGSQTSLALLAGTAWHLSRQESPLASARLGSIVRLLAITSLCTLAWAVLPDALNRLGGLSELISINYQTPGPRYWQFTDIRQP